MRFPGQIVGVPSPIARRETGVLPDALWWGKDRKGGRAMQTGLAPRREVGDEAAERDLAAKAKAPDLFPRGPCPGRRSALVAFHLKASRASDAGLAGVPRPPILSFPPQGRRNANRIRPAQAARHILRFDCSQKIRRSSEMGEYNRLETGEVIPRFPRRSASRGRSAFRRSRKRPPSERGR